MLLNCWESNLLRRPVVISPTRLGLYLRNNWLQSYTKLYVSQYFVCLHLYLSLQSGMALTYDPTAMQNGYVDLFFPSYFQITSFKKKMKCILFIWTKFPGKYLPSANSVQSPPVYVYQTKTFSNGKYAKIGEPSAQICTRALSCKWAEIFKQLQDVRAINTHLLSHPGVSFHSCLHYHVLLMQTEHLFMHLCIRPVRHVRSDCTQGKFGCYSLAVRLSSAEAMCRARYGKTRLFQREIGGGLSPLQVLLVMRSQEMPPWSSVSFPFFPIPPYSLYPYFLFVSAFVLLTCTQRSFSLQMWFWLFLASSLQAAGTSRSSLASMCALVVFKLFPTSVLRSSQFLPVKN